jgi:putative ATP-binding cassette transporter
MIRIIRYLIRQSWWLFAVVALSGTVCGLSGAAIIKVISAGITGGAGPGQRAYLFFGLCMLYLASKSCCEILLIKLTQRAVFVMRLNLSHRVLATPFEKLQALGKSEVLVILTHDIGTFMQAFQLMPLAFSNVIIIIVCFIYMAWLSWKSFLVFTAFLLIATSAYHLAELGLLRKLEIMREHMKGLYEHFRGLIEGTKELQLNARRGRSYVDNVIATRATSLKKLLVATMTGYTWILNIGAVLFYLAIGLLLFVIAPWISLRADVVTVFTLILLFLIRPIADIMTALPPLR